MLSPPPSSPEPCTKLLIPLQGWFGTLQLGPSIHNSGADNQAYTSRFNKSDVGGYTGRIGRGVGQLNIMYNKCICLLSSICPFKSSRQS